MIVRVRFMKICASCLFASVKFTQNGAQTLEMAFNAIKVMRSELVSALNNHRNTLHKIKRPQHNFDVEKIARHFKENDRFRGMNFVLCVFLLYIFRESSHNLQIDRMNATVCVVNRIIKKK